jgi:hypothetical protein
MLHPSEYPLQGFGGKPIKPVGKVSLLVFLCMNIPAPKGVITVFGDQQEARNIEKGHTLGQTNMYQLNSSEE